VLHTGSYHDGGSLLFGSFPLEAIVFFVFVGYPLTIMIHEFQNGTYTVHTSLPVWLGTVWGP